MNPVEINFWNPETSSLEVEKVYGERWLHFSYNNFFGKIGLWSMVKRSWFSKWYGSQMDKEESRLKILPFIKEYSLKTDEFLDQPESFRTFNEFFYRKLKPTARPFEQIYNHVIFPADGRHFVIPDLSKVERIYAKGQSFDLAHLLGNQNLANDYQNGAMVISRLCPVDYHRFHFPVEGNLGETSLINGSLFSVNPIALRKKISIFWENKRYCSILENQTLGKVIQLLIGATCVGTVNLTTKGNKFVNKGDEYGYFSFGGSCIITIFPPNSLRFNDDLIKQSRQGIEYYAKFGQHLGTFL